MDAVYLMYQKQQMKGGGVTKGGVKELWEGPLSHRLLMTMEVKVVFAIGS